MDAIHLFDLAAKQASWLSRSQATIAGNVSNANTPGYRAQVMKPFAEVLDQTQLSLASTNVNHIDLGPADQASFVAKDDAPWETTDSGNTVSLENELIKAGDVQRDFSLNTNLVKAFHAMLMQSVKS
ncbi:flagellar basal body rod protein FlgB [Lichenihabitans sp. Uapishka_5]|uniref:flagellar basal body rod protein FlgB n=1 Tax=Lichenihabitans sp. Uapishka_5 TaxID=3037302 RepID=UPI0029E8194A|nr:flagellar basal body rod protein FlgB [Lichenihabitans sp. Uapishka_5]MDX7952990.1 flagellar basal body rod protein FlgB [Lichenihabitans sp. Uapishka_5]